MSKTTNEKQTIIRIKNDEYPYFNVTDIREEGFHTVFTYARKDGKTWTKKVLTSEVSSIDSEH